MKKGNKVRNYVLVVLFVMIMISGIFAVSYSYYSSAASSGTIINDLVAVECLTLSTQSIYSSKPGYFFPISNDDANSRSLHCCTTGDTGEPVGYVMFEAKNNCSEKTYVDIAMISQSDNNMDFGNINYSYCSANPWYNCRWAINSSVSGYCSARTSLNYLGGIGLQNSDYDSHYSPEFQIFLQTHYGVGQTDGFCSMLGTSGVPIEANSTKNILIRYWLDKDATNYEGKKLSARFVMFSKLPDRLKNCTYATGGSCILGDVNQDWVTDFQDVELMRRYIVGTATLTNIQKKVADINQDGTINARDYASLERIALPNYGI